MAQGLAVALPLYIDSIDGAYGLHKNLEKVVTQNLKMIILASPGERVMVPEFGVGIRRYLFDQNTPGTQATIDGLIRRQVATYLPYVVIDELSVSSPPIVGLNANEKDQTRLNIYIRYRVPGANVASDLTIPVEI